MYQRNKVIQHIVPKSQLPQCGQGQNRFHWPLPRGHLLVLILLLDNGHCRDLLFDSYATDGLTKANNCICAALNSCYQSATATLMWNMSRCPCWTAFCFCANLRTRSRTSTSMLCCGFRTSFVGDMVQRSELPTRNVASTVALDGLLIVTV